MSILRNSKVKNSKPRVKDSPIPQFILSYRNILDIPVYDKDGKVVDTARKKVFEHKIIDSKEFYNEGVDCDMFSVENLQKAGINPSVVHNPLLKATLEERSYVSDCIEGLDYETLIDDDNEINIETPNNE